MTYYEKLRSPKLQKKRLEILQRDLFTCQCCLSEDKELHVHHQYYKSNTDPWDYNNDCYITFCSDCHEEQQALMQDIKEISFKINAANKSCIPLYKILQGVLVELKRQYLYIPERF